MAFDLAKTLAEFAEQVQAAGANHAPGLVPWLSRLQTAVEDSTGSRRDQCTELLEALQAFVLEDDEPQTAFDLLVKAIADASASLGGESLEDPSTGMNLSLKLNEFAEQVEAVGPSFGPGLAPWLSQWKTAIECCEGATQRLTAALLVALETFILADKNHETVYGALIDAICDLRQDLDGVTPDATPISVMPETRGVASPSFEPRPGDSLLGSSSHGDPESLQPRASEVDIREVEAASPPAVEPTTPSAPNPKPPPKAEPEPAAGFAETTASNMSMSDMVAPDIMQEFAVEGTEQLSECSEHLLLLDKNPEDAESLAAVFRCFHTIKGVAGFMGMDQLQSIAHAAEDLLDQARSGKIQLAGPPMDVIFDASDILGNLINQIPGSLNLTPWSPPETPKGPPLIERIRTILSAEAEPPKLHELPLARLDPSAPIDPPPRSSEPRSSSASSSKNDSIRVDAERLDHLVDMIGELVINESMLVRAMEIGDERETQRQLVRMGKVTREVQSVGGSLRMVPVRGCFSKMARLARDVAKKSQKKVNFTLMGEDTELDKTVVDRIADPLVHLVRNAIDHGLEGTAQERLDAGKSDVGEVQLRAFHKGGNIHIEIEDDGRGMNRDRILEVAIERGVVKNGDGMSDRDVFRLVCEAGFSTKKQVTSLSGRGVGMDVVKRQIDKMGGTLDIQSNFGTGSCFSMRVPLTLAVIDGMVIGLGLGRFVIPTLNIVRLVEPDEAHIRTIFEDGEMLIVAGETIPILRMEKLFNLEPSTAERRLAVVAEADGLRVALVIDELLGQQQAVIKNLGQGLGNVPGVSGCAIMPDGRVGLVLDISGLLDLARQAVPNSESHPMNQSLNEAPATEEQWMS